MFQSLTGRLKTVDGTYDANEAAVMFQSLTGRLKTAWVLPAEREEKVSFNPSQVG